VLRPDSNQVANLPPNPDINLGATQRNEPRPAAISHYLTLLTQPEALAWMNPGEHFKSYLDRLSVIVLQKYLNKVLGNVKNENKEVKREN